MFFVPIMELKNKPKAPRDTTLPQNERFTAS